MSFVKKFSGIHCPMVTPFKKDHSLDEEGLKKLIDFVLGEGAMGLVPCGTTGESPTLSEEEWEKVISISVDKANGKVPVIAGTGTNSTAKTIEKTKKALDIGVDACLVVTPYYNKPTQDGLISHFKSVAQAVDVPLILYDIPGRTSREIATATLVKLAKEVDTIVGVKDAAANISHTMEILRQTKDFLVLSGEDALNYINLALGGHGAICAVSNVIMREEVEMFKAAQENNWVKAREIHYRLLPVINALFAETNPAPAKAALKLMGIPAGPVRLPLVDVKPETVERLRKELAALGKIKG
ncbi:MAG: 4-hydroxy-tetrahydrodipicolinate synthase [Candidatus Diapherotrites archaeon]